MPGEREAVENAVRSGSDSQEFLQVALGLGLMVISKWDRADAKYGTTPGPEQAAEFDSFTDAEVRAFNRRASQLLGEHVAVQVDRRRPSFWLPVWQGVISAFLYSLFLVIIYLLVKHGGHDLLDIARDALEKRQ